MTNIKNHQKRVAMTLLIMLATSSLTVNFAQADPTETKSETISNADKVRTILSEQIIEGKLRLQFFGILGDLSYQEIQDMLSVKGETTNWAYLDGKTHKSGIILYNGKSLKIEEFLNSNKGEEKDDFAYQIILSAKNSKNVEGKFAVIVIDKDPKIPQQNLKLNLSQI